MLIIYTGDGKGKTSSSFGVILRTLALGKKVLLIHLIKPKKENAILDLEKHYPKFKAYNFGINKFIKKGELPQDLLNLCKAGFENLKQEYRDYDLIVIDELCVTIYFGLLDHNECYDFINKIKEEKDVILSGRKCTQDFIEIADIVTEMRAIKHHYEKGTLAKEGIDF